MKKENRKEEKKKEIKKGVREEKMELCLKRSEGCDGLNLSSLEVAYLCVGGVTICTSQLTLICLIFTSK